MRKLFYTVVLSYISTLLLPHAAMAGSLDPVIETEYKGPDNVIVDVAPINPVTPVDTGIIKDTIDLDNSIKDFDDDSLTGSIGSITDIIGKGDAVLDSDKVYTGSEDLSCKNISCADLGYSQQSITNCAEYVRCPFDVSYKICVKYNDEYALTKCPAHAVCSAKYKFTGCEDGYTQLTLSDGTISCTIPLGATCPSDTGSIKDICSAATTATYYKSTAFEGCYATCTIQDIAEDIKTLGSKKCTLCPACSDGEEQVTLDDGSKQCVKTACGMTRLSDTLLLGVDSYVTLADEKIVILSCATNFQANEDSNGCITSCTLPLAGGGGTIGGSCPVGTVTSAQRCSCAYGYKSSGTTGCYKCCTASDSSTSCGHCL